MSASDPNLMGWLSRREFLWLGGLSAAAAGMAPGLFGDAAEPATQPAANPGATSGPPAGGKRIDADVLVIGGGMAGTFAAVTARAKGLRVVLADKGTVGKSGCTPWARGFVVFDSAAGDNQSQWIENMSRSGEYINNRDSLEAVMADSLARYNDLASWGAFKEGIVNHGPVLREKLVASRVQLIERSMMTHLLLVDGRVAGAVGFSLDDEEPVVITAKAVVMCAGSGGFKPYGFPISALTSDGDAMAYRAGAIITGKEFNDFHYTKVRHPASCWDNWGQEWTRNSLISRTSFGRGGGGPGGSPDLAGALVADAGKAPVSMMGTSLSDGSGGPGGGARPGGGPPGGGPGGGDGGGFRALH